LAACPSLFDAVGISANHFYKLSIESAEGCPSTLAPTAIRPPFLGIQPSLDAANCPYISRIKTSNEECT
jgi:hypothetical protein